MGPNLTTTSKGQKFMWDGRVVDTREECLRVVEEYQRDRFEVQVVEQDGKFLIYTRRVVREPVISST